MNKMWGIIYNMEDIGVLKKILTREDCQIIPLSYTSQFGFIFKMIYQDKTEILKTYILVDSIKPSEGGEFELPNYIDINLAKELEGKKIDPFDELPGHVKRMETISNFIKEAQIQREVYDNSEKNGPLCPEIYGSYILDNRNASAFLKLLKTKCQEQLLKTKCQEQLLKTKCQEQLEGKKMIQYLQDNLKGYELGVIRMEYAEGYTTFREATKDPTLYENVIYSNIRLLMETGYMHLDLNPGNVMVRGNEVLLIDFGKSKSIRDIKHHFTDISKIIEKTSLGPKDIEYMISLINRFDAIENDSSLFQQNFVSNLIDPKMSYENIAEKLNGRESKTTSKMIKNDSITDIHDVNMDIQDNSVFRPNGLFGSESLPSNKRGSLFVSESSVKRRGLYQDPENMSPNIFSFNLGTSPRTPGGAKKSKKTKRKLLHNKRISKTRKNKSNKKRVKLISKK